MFAILNSAVGAFWAYMAFCHGEMQLDDSTQTLIYVCFALMSFMQAATNYERSHSGNHAHYY